MLFIFLSEFNYEFNDGIVYEGLGGMNDDNTKAYDIIGDNSIFPDIERKKKKDLLTIDQALRPTDGNIDVSTIEDK